LVQAEENKGKGERTEGTGQDRTGQDGTFGALSNEM